jgi:protein-disulfide isomerase
MHGIAAASLTSSDWMILTGILLAWTISVIVVRVRFRLGALVSSAFGLAASIYLIKQKYSDTSICSGESTSIFDCDAINQSAYSSLGPLPVATLGAAFFLSVLYVSWRAQSQPDQHSRFPQFLLLAGLCATGASAVMAVISFGIIGSVCPFCVSLYGLSLILAWAGWSATSNTGGSLLQRLKGASAQETTPDASHSSAMVVFLLGIVALYVYYQPDVDAVPEVGEVKSNIELIGDEPSKGASDAPYLVMEFADFQCPSCAVLHPEMETLVRENEDIGVIFKHYPLEFHPHAFMAAKATVCAQEQGKFWPMSERIFENQEIFTDCDDPASSFCAEKIGRDMRFFAGQLEMNTGAFTACMNKDSTAERVQKDMDLGETLELRGTPSLFLLGVKGEGEWVQVEGRGAAVLALVQAHREGLSLPVASAEAEGAADH